MHGLDNKMANTKAAARTVALATMCVLIAACGNGHGGDGHGGHGEDVGSDAGMETGADAISDVSADVSVDADADVGVDIGVGEIEALPIESLTVPSLGYCQIDFDCAAGAHCFAGYCVSECDADTPCTGGATCTSDGRCGGDQKNLDAFETSGDLRIRRGPSSQSYVGASDEGVLLGFQVESVSGAELPDELRYIIEDSEGAVDDRLLRRAPVRDGEAVIEVPIDRATLDESRFGLIDCRVTTEAGSLTTTLVPAPTASGEYGGTVRMARFGSVELPIRFDVVTSPADAPLEDAESVWLVVPAGAGELFSPTVGGVEATPVVRTLTYDALIERWVATMRHDYPFDEGSFLASADGVMPQRTMRFELELLPTGEMFGSMTDRWTGLYDVRTSGGTVQPAVVLFEGDLELRRTGDALMTPEEAEAAQGADDPRRADTQPLPSVDACADLADVFVDATGAPLVFEAADGDLLTCDGVDTIAAFLAADDGARASCARAIGETALVGDTTAALLREFFNDDGVTPGDQSFDEFMQACAAGVDGLCRPQPEVLCARELVARTWTEPAEVLADGEALVELFGRLSREAFLGRQLGAFRTDADLRLEWLQLNNLPDFVTSVLRDFIAGQLDEWRTTVLDVHLEVVAGQYDPVALALLSRQVTAEASVEERKQLLLEMSQAWRGAMETLVIAAQRWNSLHVAAADRQADLELVSARARDLYVLAGAAANLNQSADAGFANATFSGGFGALLREQRKLALPFSALIYARDAEVVVSRSLDPEASNRTLLADLEANAMAAIRDAAEAVDGIIAETADRELNATLVQNELNNQIDEVVDTLIELCGLPRECTRSDVASDVAGCEIRVGAGECGFSYGAEDTVDGTLASEAASAYLAVVTALEGVTLAEQEYGAAEQRAARAEANAEAFAVQIEAWNTVRLDAVGAIDTIIQESEAASEASLAAVMEVIGEQNDLRRQLAEDAEMDAAAWNRVRVDGVTTDFRKLRAAFGLRQTADAATLVSDSVLLFAEASVESQPRVIGTSGDPFAVLRGAAYMKAAVTQTVGRTAAQALRVGAEELQTQVDQARALRAAELSNLREQDIADDLEVQNTIDDLRARMEVDLTRTQIREFQLDRLIEQIEARTEAELAYKRDRIELNDRIAAAFRATLELADLRVRINQAQLQVLQRELEYARVVERAGLQSARLAQLQSQASNVNALLGSPAIIFAWTNSLARAEARLERAKASVMDWLVAMEYYAVRPFMDQRIQILLARNTFQLEGIAAEMSRLQGVCGGSTNLESVDLSVARYLNLTEARSNDERGEVYEPSELLIASMQRGDVNVDRRVRLGSVTSGLDLASRDDIWSATVTFDVDEFGNLASSCNARIDAFDVQLVGEDLGDALPTVSIVYDGTSRLRSCQPDLVDYIEGLDPGATSFSDVTTFRSPSRAISVIAGVNQFTSDNFAAGVNRTLSGLPLASSYTILIDPITGANADINWANVEDIRLRVRYGYQDFFPRGECL